MLVFDIADDIDHGARQHGILHERLRILLNFLQLVGADIRLDW
jgi:hypothetical protein